MPTLLQFSYSLVLVDVFLADSTYVDPHDQCRSLEHHFQQAIEFLYLLCGVHMITWTWDLGLQCRLDYFNMVASTSTWDPNSLVSFSIMVHTYLWNLGIWLYFLIKRIEDNTLLRGMQCSVARGIIWDT
jgi:hypothetical protein